MWPSGEKQVAQKFSLNASLFGDRPQRPFHTGGLAIEWHLQERVALERVALSAASERVASDRVASDRFWHRTEKAVTPD